MLSILLKLGFCLLFFEAIVIHGNDDDDMRIDLERIFEAMSQKNEKIDSVLLPPAKDGFIHKGKYGVVYKSIHIDGKLEVAMKFMKKEFIEKAQHEIEMYRDLNAFKNPEVEKFGIANCYYYNENWNGYFLTILSYFDGGNLLEKAYEGYFHQTNEMNSINTLIVLRDFVRQSKYLHSHGIVYNNIMPEHIVFRGRRTFLIDFSDCTMLYKFYYGRKTPFLSNPNNDWKRFLYCIFYISFETLDLSTTSKFQNMKTDESFEEYVLMMEEIGDNDVMMETLNEFNRSLITPLTRFYHNISPWEKYFPDYDDMDSKINESIDKYYKSILRFQDQKNVEKGTSMRIMEKIRLNGKKAEDRLLNSKTALFTWLPKQSKATTASSEQQFTIRSICEIKNPTSVYINPQPILVTFPSNNQEENKATSVLGCPQKFKGNK